MCYVVCVYCDKTPFSNAVSGHITIMHWRCICVAHSHIPNYYCWKGCYLVWIEISLICFEKETILLWMFWFQKKISWKLYYVSYVNKLGMFQNDMMSYDSTLFHGTLTNWGHEKNWVKTSWSVLSKHPDMMCKYILT